MKEGCPLKWLFVLLLGMALTVSHAAGAQEDMVIKSDKQAADLKKLQTESNTSDIKADSAWMLVATALVMLMVPGLALFYGGMVRRKNILATMMQSMVALAIIGVYWIAIGYSLAF